MSNTQGLPNKSCTNYVPNSLTRIVNPHNFLINDMLNRFFPSNELIRRMGIT